MIIIINGPLGIGKTSVTEELLYHFEHAVMLDGDHIGAVVPFDIYDPGRIEYLYQTIQHLVAWHVAHGYRDFVIDYVFEEPESLARLRQLLSESSDEIYAFRLVCAEAEMEQRIHRRAQASGSAGADLDWELQRFRQLLEIQNAATQRGDLGFVIDTTHLSVQGVAEAIWSNVREGVELASYDPAWPAQFEAERERIRAALGDLTLQVQHIGSTAVPGLPAKPVIDILVSVRQLADAAACIPPLAQLGYTFIDYPQNTDRRFFRKGLPRTHHLHIVAQGSPAERDHLAFRDALRSRPAWREQYAQLKAELAARYKNDRAKYSESKTAFVEGVLQEWRNQQV